MGDDPIPPCYSFHIGEVIQIWLARLMWSLRNISHILLVVTLVTDVTSVIADKVKVVKVQ